jgi:hypothetical protein
MTVFRKMLETALEYYQGGAGKTRKEVISYMESVKKTLTINEKEYFDEKAGAFINDGYNREEADAEALDMVIKMRPNQGATEGT